MGQMQDSCKTSFNVLGRDIKIPMQTSPLQSSRPVVQAKPYIALQDFQRANWITEDSWRSDNSTPSPTDILPLPAEQDQIPEITPAQSLQINIVSEAESEDTIIQEVSMMMGDLLPSSEIPEISFKDRRDISKRMEDVLNTFVPRVKNRDEGRQKVETDKPELRRNYLNKDSNPFAQCTDKESEFDFLASYSKENELPDVETLLNMAEARLSSDTSISFTSSHDKAPDKIMKSFDSSYYSSYNSTLNSSHLRSNRSLASARPSKPSKPPLQMPKIVSVDLSTRKFTSRQPTPKRNSSNSRRIQTPNRSDCKSLSKEPISRLVSNLNIPAVRRQSPKPIVRSNSNPWAENRKVREKLKEYYS
jgi:hypothetical protein